MFDLVIVGAGLSGIRAAKKAAELGVKNAVVVDYLDKAGGFTLPYFGTPEFDQETKQLENISLPFPIWTKSMVVGLFAGEEDQPHQLYIQKSDVTEMIETRHLLIASGSLEKPREAHRVPGERPSGVMTPYLAMRLLLKGEVPGKRVLSVGDTRMHRCLEERLIDSGCEVTSFNNKEIDVSHILGSSRVSGVQYIDTKTMEQNSWEGDTFIFSKDRIPCTFFLKGTPVERDRKHAVIIDSDGRTNIPRIYAVGSCTPYGDDNHSNSIQLVDQHLAALWKEMVSLED